MSDISINQTSGQISIKLKVNSMQQVSFTITIYAPDGNTVLEHYTGSSQIANPFIIQLPNTPSSYVNDYVAGTIKLFDPAGAGNNYDIEISLIQNGQDINPVISLQGTTISGILSLQTIYHIK